MVRVLEYIGESIIWGPFTVALLLISGIFLNFKTGFFLFRRLGFVLRQFFDCIRPNNKNRKAGEASPFSALCTALAGTVGTGNIVGVGLALKIGGEGALFWIWISALIGMAVKYSEVSLAVKFRCKNKNGETVGGPMYYIENGLNFKLLAFVFSLLGVLASFFIGAAVQANSVSSSVNALFPIPKRIIGAVLSLLCGLVLIGGAKRIAKVTSYLVPFMSAFYIIGALTVVIINIKALPSAFLDILKGAFSFAAPLGGIIGAGAMTAVKTGLSKGVFTHEAGMGSAPIAHASASTDHPARQGLMGAVEVFFDSIVICSVTGLAVITSGVLKRGNISGGEITAESFKSAFSGGEYIVYSGLCLFAFATIIAWVYYGERCAEYLLKQNKIAVFIYKAAYIAAVFLGCLISPQSVWLFADLFNGLMMFPNLIALIALSPEIKALTNDFFNAQIR